MHALKATSGADNLKLAQVETLQQSLKDLSEQLDPKTIFELDLAVSSKALCLVAVYSLPF
jgi:predicted nucleic acid-binding protein